MKLSHNRLNEMNAAFRMLAQKECSPLLGLAIIKNTRVIAPHLDDYHTKRLELLAQYALVDDDGNLIPGPDGMAQFMDGSREQYEEAMRPLAEEEVEVTIHQVSVTEIEKLGAVTPLLIEMIEPMIAE